MPDTAVLRTPAGWIDRDQPGQAFKTRREARRARKAKRFYTRPLPVQATSASGPAVTSSAFQLTTPAHAGLSRLQQRLYDRLTGGQGVTAADAFDVVTSMGYNKAASYGHMRAAGATHGEAVEVVDLEDPDYSLAYGRFRAAGNGHDRALRLADGIV
jgi:hypothetical protein